MLKGKLAEVVHAAEARAAVAAEHAQHLREIAASKAANHVEFAAAAAAAVAEVERLQRNESDSSKAAAEADSAAKAAEATAADIGRAASAARLMAEKPITATRPSGGSTWDFHVSVHCVKPTGKPAATTEFDIEALLAESAQAIESQRAAVDRAREAVALREQDVIAAQGAEKAARKELLEQERLQRKLLEQQQVLASGRWSPPLPPFGVEAALNAWTRALTILETRLKELHQQGPSRSRIRGGPSAYRSSHSLRIACG